MVALVSDGMPKQDDYGKPVVHCSGRRRFHAVVMGMFVVCGVAYAPAQRVNPAQQRLKQIAANQHVASRVMVIEAPAPIVNLFARAEQGVLRRDWKFTIDSLQRVINDPRDSLLPRSGGAIEGGMLYESGRRRAVQQLAELPPEGLRAYRLLYDGKAKGLLERAAAAHDESTLRIIVDRFLLTRFGDDAADLLASWALDDGRPGEALTVLTDLTELVPDYDVSEMGIIAKVSAAQVMLGRRRDAIATLEAYRTGAPDDEIPDWLTNLVGDDAVALAMQADQTDVESSLNTGDLDSWPMAGGAAHRRGRMPPVTPTLVSPLPWRFDLPGSSSGSWRRVLEDDPAEPLALPVRRAVIDAGHLYVSRSNGCAALRADDLSVAWEWPPPPESRGRVQRASGDPSSIETDEVGTAIAAGLGMVFTVQRTGTGSPIEVSDGVVIAPRRAPRRGARGAATGHSPTRIVALDQATGALRWDRGRTFDLNDPLGDVEFRSAPLTVDDALWVPFIEQRDLYVGVIDPADGALTRRILLGTLPPIAHGRAPVLNIAFADGMVYIPSEQGVLFAVDVDDFALRWAAQYGTHAAPGAQNDTRRGAAGRRRARRKVPATARKAHPFRFPSPPVVAGGLVLLAPTGRDELLAFSSATGAFRWAVPVGNSAYVIAADQNHVWIGGRSITCRSLSDGASVWTTGAGVVPTGQAILSGDVIWVPHAIGLVSLDAATGIPGHSATTSEEEPPLGNLICAAAAMYSVDGSSVRRFPDIVRPYVDTRNNHAADPGDVGNGLRLAWLEFLRGDPRRASLVLDGIDSSALETDPRRADAVAHLQVESLRAMARQVDAAEGMDMLERALKVARADRDRVRCRLEIVDRHSEQGRRVKACRALLDMAMAPAAHALRRMKDNVGTELMVEVVRRFTDIAATLTSAERDEFSEHLEGVVVRALDALRRDDEPVEALRKLTTIADLPVPPHLRVRVLIALADRHRDRRRHEIAEQFLMTGLRLDVGAKTGVVLLDRLCRLYADTGALGGASLESLLDRLVDRYGEEMLPNRPDVTALVEPARPESSMVSVRSLVDRARNLLAGEHEADQADQTARAPHGLVAQSKPLWSISPPLGQQRPTTEAPFELKGDLKKSLDSTKRFGPPRLIRFAGSQRRAGDDQVIYHGPNDVLYGQRAATGELLWYTSLRLPETFTATSGARQGSNTLGRRAAVAEGQICVINGRLGLFGIGRVSGRRLWVRPHEYPTSLNPPGQDAARDALMAAGDGLLAAMPRSGRLTLMRMRDGSTVWERDLRGEPVADVRINESSVITVGPLRQRVHLFDRIDGKLIKRIRFQQPDLEGGPIRLVDTGGIICGVDGANPLSELLAVDLATGEEAWRLRLDKPIAQLFEPAPGFVGVGLLGGDVCVVGSATGDPVIELRVVGAGSVSDGVLLDGILIVRYDRTRNNRRYPELAALDVSTGEELWRRDDLAAGADAMIRLDVVDGGLPVLVEIAGHGRNRRTRSGLAIVDVRTGANRGELIDLELTRSRVQFSGDLVLAPGAVIIGTKTGVEAYRTEPLPSENGNNF